MSEPPESLEETKLRLEIDKLRAEIRNLRLPPILHPSAYVPLLVALISLVGTYMSLSSQLNEKKEEVIGVQSNIQALEKAIPNETLDALQRVDIQFRGSVTRSQINGLQQKLNSTGFVAASPLRTSTITDSAVEYYDEADESFAAKVSDLASDYFSKLGCPLTLPPTKATTTREPRSILLRVYHVCR